MNLKGRTGLMMIALVYAVYSIGRGMWGLALESEPGMRVLLGLLFAALLGLCGWTGYRLYFRYKAADEEEKAARAEAEAQAALLQAQEAREESGESVPLTAEEPENKSE